MSLQTFIDSADTQAEKHRTLNRWYEKTCAALECLDAYWPPYFTFPTVVNDPYNELKVIALSDSVGQAVEGLKHLLLTGNPGFYDSEFKYQLRVSKYIQNDPVVSVETCIVSYCGGATTETTLSIEVKDYPELALDLQESYSLEFTSMIVRLVGVTHTGGVVFGMDGKDFLSEVLVAH